MIARRCLRRLRSSRRGYASAHTSAQKPGDLQHKRSTPSASSPCKIQAPRYWGQRLSSDPKGIYTFLLDVLSLVDLRTLQPSPVRFETLPGTDSPEVPLSSTVGGRSSVAPWKNSESEANQDVDQLIETPGKAPPAPVKATKQGGKTGKGSGKGRDAQIPPEAVVSAQSPLSNPGKRRAEDEGSQPKKKQELPVLRPYRDTLKKYGSR